MVNLWAVTVSHSSITCDSHYTYCSHHSLRSPSSLRSSDHSLWAGRALNGGLCSTSRRLAPKVTDKRRPGDLENIYIDIKRVHMILQVLLTGAVWVFLVFFSWVHGVLLLEAPRCKHVTSPAVMALTNCFTYCGDKRQSWALYNSLVIHRLFVYLFEDQLHFGNR